jgi:hypothetical protein
MIAADVRLLSWSKHEVPAMDGNRADEQAAHKPHRPCATADARGAVCLPEVGYLGDIGQHRDRDSCNAENFKHGFASIRSLLPCRRLHRRSRLTPSGGGSGAFDNLVRSPLRLSFLRSAVSEHGAVASFPFLARRARSRWRVSCPRRRMAASIPWLLDVPRRFGDEICAHLLGDPLRLDHDHRGVGVESPLGDLRRVSSALSATTVLAPPAPSWTWTAGFAFRAALRTACFRRVRPPIWSVRSHSGSRRC